MILGRRWLPKFCLLGTPLAQYRLRLRHLFRFSAQERSRAAHRVILVCIVVAFLLSTFCVCLKHPCTSCQPVCRGPRVLGLVAFGSQHFLRIFHRGPTGFVLVPFGPRHLLRLFRWGPTALAPVPFGPRHLLRIFCCGLRVVVMMAFGS